LLAIVGHPILDDIMYKFVEPICNKLVVRMEAFVTGIWMRLPRNEASALINWPEHALNGRKIIIKGG